MPARIFNPVELNAEYLLIPGGKYKFSVSTKETKARQSSLTEAVTELVEVPSLYFARHPVTNKLYRRFVDYLSGKSKDDALHHLSREQFAKSLLTEAQKIKDFSGYVGDNFEQWADKLRSEYSEYNEEKRFNGDDQPVVGVTWFAAMAYCHWLSELQGSTARLSSPKSSALFPKGASGKGQREKAIYRLPTEEEWEWAASGGKRKYPWGNEEPDDTRANYSEKVGHTTPVGAYPAGATPEGLMDMAGNVWEWMENRYGLKDYPEARALRGGSWDDDSVYLRCSSRVSRYPDFRGNGNGFRVVCSQSSF